MKVILFLVCALASSHASACVIAGIYDGTLTYEDSKGKNVVPTETVFEDKGKSIVGHYTVHYEKLSSKMKAEKGTLTQVTLTGVNVTATWKDRAGNGKFFAKFNDEGTEFTGYFTAKKSDKPEAVWTGVRRIAKK